MQNKCHTESLGKGDVSLQQLGLDGQRGSIRPVEIETALTDRYNTSLQLKPDDSGELSLADTSCFGGMYGGCGEEVAVPLCQHGSTGAVLYIGTWDEYPGYACIAGPEENGLNILCIG